MFSTYFFQSSQSNRERSFLPPTSKIKDEVKSRAGKTKKTLPQQRLQRRSAAQKNKKIRQDSLRASLQGKAFIRGLEESSKKLTEISENLAIAKVRKGKINSADREALSVVATQLEILAAQREVVKVQMDLNIKRLKFVLPELRSVEYTDGEGNTSIPHIRVTFK